MSGAEKKLQQLDLDSNSVLRSARKAAAKLQGKEQEIGLLELHEIVNDRLQAWLGWVSSRNSLEAAATSDTSVRTHPIPCLLRNACAWCLSELLSLGQLVALHH